MDCSTYRLLLLCKMLNVISYQARFYIAAGDTSPLPNLAFLPKCNTKHCLTNSKHRHIHIGAKKSVLWLSKYAKVRCRPGLHPVPRWGALDAPRALSRLGSSHTTRHGASILTPSAIDSIWISPGCDDVTLSDDIMWHLWWHVQPMSDVAYWHWDSTCYQQCVSWKIL